MHSPSPPLLIGSILLLSCKIDTLHTRLVATDGSLRFYFPKNER